MATDDNIDNFDAESIIRNNVDFERKSNFLSSLVFGTSVTIAAASLLNLAIPSLSGAIGTAGTIGALTATAGVVGLAAGVGVLAGIGSYKLSRKRHQNNLVEIDRINIDSLWYGMTLDSPNSGPFAKRLSKLMESGLRNDDAVKIMLKLLSMDESAATEVIYELSENNKRSIATGIDMLAKYNPGELEEAPISILLQKLYDNEKGRDAPTITQSSPPDPTDGISAVQRLNSEPNGKEESRGK